jgi:hypothetical protein
MTVHFVVGADTEIGNTVMTAALTALWPVRGAELGTQGADQPHRLSLLLRGVNDASWVCQATVPSA